ncbi:MAG: DUF3611 family protein [Phormidesmis sp.]
MTGELGYALPPAIRRIATNFRLAGWVGFWAQIVVGVISSMMFVIFLMRPATAVTSSKAGLGIFIAPALVVVFIGAFWGFRYTRFAQKMRTSNPDLRPKPKDAVRVVRIGLIISLVGMALSIMGAEASIAALLERTLSQGPVVMGLPGNVSAFITTGDILPLFSVVNAMFTHFIGLCVSLWLEYIINR